MTVVLSQKISLAPINCWNKSEDCKLFWTARQRKKNRLDAEAAVVDFLGAVINQETRLLNQATIPSPIQTNIDDTSQAEGRDEKVSNLSEETSDSIAVTENRDDMISFNEDKNLSGFEISKDDSIYCLFSDHKKKAMQKSTDEFRKIETNLHELLSLIDIFLLTPDQHSEALSKVFPQKLLNSSHSSLVNQFNSRFEETDTDREAQVLNQVSKIIAWVEKKKKKEAERGEAELRLWTLARGREYSITRAIKVINNL